MIKRNCKYCQGTGKEPVTYLHAFSLNLSIPSACSVCNGKGFNLFECEKKDLLKCKSCDGTGRMTNQNIEVIFAKCKTCNGTGFLNLQNIHREDSYDFWQLVDERIKKVAKPRFDNEHYADSVEAAFKELNSTIKLIVLKETKNEYDGSQLMERAFSLKNPIIHLANLNTVNGRNVQKGFMQIYAGAMIGIRNPNAHTNLSITRELSIQYLILSSLLMSMLPK